VAAAQSESTSLGTRLKTAREHAGLTVIQAAERLHVDPHLIEALEGERFEELGASVYVRGHVRHYAELVGESPVELQELYSRSAHAARPLDLTRVPKAADPAGASSALLVPAVLVVGVVAIIGMVWWVAGTLNAARPAHRGHPSARQPSSTVAVQPANAIPATVIAASAVGAAAAAPSSGQQPLSPGAPLPGTPSSRTPLSGTQAERANAPNAPAPVAVRRAALTMHFAEDSWTEVYDARGERLFYDIGSADSTRTVSGVPPLKIVLGNPVVVSLELDGRPVSMPEGARRNVMFKFRITRSGQAAPAHLAAAGERHASSASVQAP
jgi:cytoskeleton protein RodZ